MIDGIAYLLCGFNHKRKIHEIFSCIFLRKFYEKQKEERFFTGNMIKCVY